MGGDASTTSGDALHAPAGVVVPRYDVREMNTSSAVQGMRRLRIIDILQLRKGDEFTLLVPPTDRKQPRKAIAPRRGVLQNFRRVILGAAGRRMSAADRDKYYAADLNGRSIVREGKPNHEINV